MSSRGIHNRLLLFIISRVRLPVNIHIELCLVREKKKKESDMTERN
jgi:hypothetical protein